MLRDTDIHNDSPQTDILKRRSALPAWQPTTQLHAVRLARYLDGFSVPATVLNTSDAPFEALDSENAIALGNLGNAKHATALPGWNELCSQRTWFLSRHSDPFARRFPEYRIPIGVVSVLHLA